jgi:hypothetical protein
MGYSEFDTEQHGCQINPLASCFGVSIRVPGDQASIIRLGTDSSGQHFCSIVVNPARHLVLNLRFAHPMEVRDILVYFTREIILKYKLNIAN